MSPQGPDNPTDREQLPLALRARVEFLEDYQLQVEHALDLVGRERLLPVDASLTGPAPFSAQLISAARDASYTSHALSPQALLQVFADVQGCAHASRCRLLRWSKDIEVQLLIKHGQIALGSGCQ